jgi:DNA-binding helix-hairpin-helix protein with protein kinase domain
MASSSTSFEAGRAVRLAASGYEAKVLDLIGSGGQGSVYRVDVLGSHQAIKWYHPHYLPQDTRLRARLAEAIERGTPDPRFLWPIELVEIKGEKSFGYLMLLRQHQFQASRNLLGPTAKRLNPSLAVRTMACLNIAESFLQLHAKGFCYQDISLNNVFLDPNSGAICICDNDNVDVDGMPGAIYGTRKFMAPEVVRREAFPSTATDLFSMAVLFFYILHSWHPLDGRREMEVMILDSNEELKLYGTQPLFMFDPQDDSNGPLDRVHDSVVRRWKSLSEAIRKSLTRSFTAGLEPSKRVVETEWLTALSRMNDSLVACERCGYEHALGSASDLTQGRASFSCVACNAAIPVPARLVIGRDSVVLAPSRALYAHHFTTARTYCFDKAAALVQAHPSDPKVLGLRNLTENAWSASFPDGRNTTIVPGKTIRIMPGLIVDFGSRRGTVVA